MKIITVFLFSCLLGVGCASAPVIQSYVVPGFDMQKYKTVAVMPIVNLSTNSPAVLQVPDLVEQDLKVRNFGVMKSTDVQKTLQNEVSKGNSADSISYAEVGRWLGTDGILSVVVGAYGYENRTRPKGYYSYTYTTYSKTSSSVWIIDKSAAITTAPLHRKTVSVPIGEYRVPVAEIMISLYDGKSGELVFRVLDHSSGGVAGSLQEAALLLISKELSAVLGHGKIRR